MTRLLLALLLFPVLSLGGHAQQIVIGVPVAQPSITSYRPISLLLQRGDAATGHSAEIVVRIASTDHRIERFVYPCANGCAALDTVAEVDAIITALNTANLSTRALWYRIFDVLVRDFPERFSGGGTVQ